MDLREYAHIESSPDTFPKSTLKDIKGILREIGSPYGGLIDRVLAQGYIKPPKAYKWHGYYRIVLTDNEKQMVLDELARAKSMLSGDTDRDWHLNQYVDYWKRCIEEKSVPYEEAVKTQQYYDLREAALEDFQDFLFSHNVPDRHEEAGAWFHDFRMWIEHDQHKDVELYRDLFRHSAELLERYTKAQLEQGFWGVMSGISDVCLDDLIWHSDLDISSKEKLIRSIYDLYANLFVVEPLRHTCHMWWDSLAYGFHPMGRHSRENSEEERRIQDVMFQTLVRILELDDDECQCAALHGLGHVQHPETKKTIAKYLRKHPDISEDLKEYATACIGGDML
jgi:hypothetical protein